MFDAIKDGDLESYNKLYDAVIESGVKERTVANGIKNQVRESDERIADAAGARIKGNTYKQLLKNYLRTKL